MKLDLSIENGHVVTESGVRRMHIGVRHGKVACLLDAVEDPLPAESRIDAHHLVVFPGMVEPHCHFWDPGPTHREDWETGTMAAAAGGITTVVEMPISNPPTVDRDSFLLKKDIASRRAVVDFALWGGVIPGIAKDLAQHLSELRNLGAVAYKAFMCWSASEFPPVDDGLLYAAMLELAKTDQLLGVHAENETMIKQAEAVLHAAGRTDPLAHVESRPPEAELEAIRRALFLAQRAGNRLHIVHLSLADGAEVIRDAKHQGQRVTVETTPHYLILDSAELQRQGPYAKCAPPLRPRDNVERLWRYLADGTIDFIGTDHAPFTEAEKDRGRFNIWDAPNGLPGLQEVFSLVLSEGVHKRGLPLERVAAVCASNTARAFRLYPQKGTIAPGSDADLILVDIDREWEVHPDRLYYKNKWTPYAGMKLRGQILKTIVRGHVVYSEGEVLANPGCGRFIMPLRPNQRVGFNIT